jgi:hypothetical protein
MERSDESVSRRLFPMVIVLLEVVGIAASAAAAVVRALSSAPSPPSR